MPFYPLPAIFLEDLSLARPSSLLELGSGDGTFTAELRRHGVEPVTIDRRDSAAGAVASIRGDALKPPLRGHFSLVVVANLLRHLWPRLRREGPRYWCDLVAPGGSLWIFEDEPLAEPAPARNYRDLQDFLARLDPRLRQPLLASTTFRQQRRRWRWPGRWQDGDQENRWPLAADSVTGWLAAGVREAGGEADRLATAIARDGLACGRYWWARWQPEATA